MKIINVLLLLVMAVLINPLASLPTRTAAAGEMATIPDGLLDFPLIPGLIIPKPFSEIIQCINSLIQYAGEIFQFIVHGTPPGELLCKAIRDLPPSCLDALHALLNIPVDQGVRLKGLCGVPAPPATPTLPPPSTSLPPPSSPPPK